MSEDMLKTSAELRDRVAKIRATYGDVVDYEEAPSFSPTYRMGLFHRADVLLQTPIREGINLLPLEYVYARTQWQIMRSKMVEEQADAAAAAAAAATSAPTSSEAAAALAASNVPGGGSADAGQGSSGGGGARGGEQFELVSEASLPDAALKAISQGMPESYATLAAPPSSSARTQKARPSVMSIFTTSASHPPPSAAPPPSSAATAAAQVAPPPPTMSRQLTGVSEGSYESGPASPPPSVVAEAAGLVAPLPPPLRGGCVILSEFAAASHILNSNLLVNPWNIARVAKEIDTALTMPDHERSFRQWRDYKYAVKTPAAIWSRRVIADVLETRIEADRVGAAAAVSHPVRAPPSLSPPGPACAATAGLPPLDIPAAIRAFLAAPTRLLVLDYGGTIVSNRAESSIEFAADGYSGLLPPAVADALAGLSQDPRNTVFIVSGKRSAAVEALHLARLPHVGLAAENGWLVSLPDQAAARLAAARARHAAVGGAAAAGAGGTLEEVALGGSLRFELSNDLGAGGSSASLDGAVSPLVAEPLWAASGSTSVVTPPHTGRQWAPMLASASESHLVSDWLRVKGRALEIMSDYQWRVNGSVSGPQWGRSASSCWWRSSLAPLAPPV